MTLTDHGTLDQVFMVSKKWWDKLPKSCQTEVQAAVDAGSKVSFDKTYEDIGVAMKAFEKAGMKVVKMSPDQKQVLAKAVQPTRAFYVNLTHQEGKPYLDKFDAVIAQVEK
jgi:C4-dicarboxylate-binding protein DctP